MSDKKTFYKHIFALMIPILIQNGITNFVSMLDNVMVGRLGTAEVTGVSVANQLILVFTLCVFGAVSGAGIFGAQFFGSGDIKSLRDTFRFKLVFCTLLTLGCIALFLFAGEPLISLFLEGENDDPADIAATLFNAKRYLNIILIGLLPFTWAQCYSSTLRETGQTVMPMAAGIAAVLVNLGLNYVLIFGNFGAPRLGVAGAAVATCVSRFVEFGIVAVSTAVTRNKNTFIIGAFKSLRVPTDLVKKILAKGLPLMLNETMWAAGLATVTRFYSLRGLEVVTANTINQTFANVFSVAFIAVGMAIGIVLGQMLGAGKTDEAKDSARRLMRFAVLVSIVIAALFALFAPIIPRIYNTTDSVRELATGLMLICAATMPLDAYANAAYFTLRSGGQALVTIIFDSGFVWAVSVVSAMLLAKFTALPILHMYAIVQSLNFIKCVVGYAFFRRGTWAKNIVAE